ncbi:DUF3113 family protein, partial [Staphylococcus aureus]|nr:DUF3113 family protein [Staphylococcus aureus]MBU7977564.1 DUF3113 family protein [Staphylococcus aureus]MBZ5329367.1 DUF3113 family protein [Staphylococcus aureus]MBZ5332037.1 DUF3113 family protein [Staphylococcus aureus]NGR81187.1 DUF3113 family protein [Staphylococcus aureus]
MQQQAYINATIDIRI